MTGSTYLATTATALRVLFDADDVFVIENPSGAPAVWCSSRRERDATAETVLRRTPLVVDHRVVRGTASPLGRYQLALSPTPSGRTWLVVRADRDFGDDDVRRAEGVCPLLTAIDRFIPAFSSAPTALAPLSPRERQVVELLVTGCTARRIASTLGISPRTVGKHLQNAYEKLGHHDRLLIAVQHNGSLTT